MSEWKEYKLGDVCSRLSSGKSIKSETILPDGKYPVWGGNGIRGYTNICNFSGRCCIIGRQGAYCGNVHFFEGVAYMTEHAVVAVGNHLADSYFLACQLSQMHLENLSAQSAQPGISVKTLSTQPICLPPIEEQKRIAGVLSSLDDKIDLLRRENATLEDLAETLFRHYFIENPNPNWKEVPLSSIATFLNGLACQKYPSKDLINRLPVLKIKELSSGITKDSDWATTDIEEEYIVHPGDVIFAWSASLMVKIWDGEECVLNQHLFKVSSTQYPKWFYYFWCKHHLQEFISIAQSHATTMGHIKRGDLDNAMVLVPSKEELNLYSNQIDPLFDKYQNNNEQLKALSAQRDTLLPRLMNGEVKVCE